MKKGGETLLSQSNQTAMTHLGCLHPNAPSPPPSQSVVLVRGAGFIGAEVVPQAQARVYRFNWLEFPTPSPEELESSVQQLPTNGRPLDELTEDDP